MWPWRRRVCPKRATADHAAPRRHGDRAFSGRAAKACAIKGSGARRPRGFRPRPRAGAGSGCAGRGGSATGGAADRDRSVRNVTVLPNEEIRRAGNHARDLLFQARHYRLQPRRVRQARSSGLDVNRVGIVENGVGGGGVSDLMRSFRPDRSAGDQPDRSRQGPGSAALWFDVDRRRRQRQQ